MIRLDDTNAGVLSTGFFGLGMFSESRDKGLVIPVLTKETCIDPTRDTTNSH